MAWYTSSDNHTNLIRVPEAWGEKILCGTAGVAAGIALELVADLAARSRTCFVALDGFKGTRIEELARAVEEALRQHGVEVCVFKFDSVFLCAEKIDALARPFDRPDDPSFGRVFTGQLDDFLDEDALRQTRAAWDALREEGVRRVVLCHGVGAALASRICRMDRVAYLDITRHQLFVRTENGEVNLVGGGRQEGFPWKRVYYVEYPALNRHKKKALRIMDWYIEDSSPEPRLVPAEIYHAIITELSGLPLSLKVFYMPGPFGGSEFGERFKVRGLPNTSWDYEISVGDNHLIVDLGKDCVLEIALYNLIWEQPLRVLGAKSQEKYPDHFPIAIYMQDGYFPPDDQADFKRTHMPHHLHPDTAYCREHFGEPLGRYEAYYIVRADPGAVTMHGFQDDADIDEYIREVRQSAATGEEFVWRKYIYEHPSKTGELHQLPPGTVHGTGGRQVILEIDTNPSRESTEYSLYLYDFCRANFNYHTNELTGSPLKLTLDHSLAQMRRDRRQNFMANKCRAAPVVIREGEGWREMSFPMCDEMPYQVNRFEFSGCIEDDTDDLFHCLSLTAGTRVRISSRRDISKNFVMEDCDTIILPACFGEYVCENLAEGRAELIKTFLR